MIGAYWINLEKNDLKLFGPLRALGRDKGVLYMLGVAIIWGVTSSLDKVAVVNSSPIFFSFFVAATTSSLLLPCIVLQKPEDLKSVFQTQNLKRLVPIGLLDGVLILTQMTAISLTLATYVVAIKRSSILFSSLLGFVFFKEDLTGRIPAIFLMLFGVGLILLFG